MESVKKSLIVDAAIWRVFGLWRRLENFPKFIHTVREVRWLEKGRLLWRAQDVDGAEFSAIFDIRYDLAQCRINWQSASGADNRGDMHFEPLPGSRTLLTLTMQFAADAGLQQPVAVSQRLEGYLNGFKKFVETKSGSQKLATALPPVGAWTPENPEPVGK